MPNVVSGTSPPSAQPHDHIRALLRAGKNDEAIVQLCAINVTRPDDLEVKELLFDAYFQKRNLMLAHKIYPDWRCEIYRLGIPRVLSPATV